MHENAFPAEFEQAKWYVLFVRSNQEKQVADRLFHRGIHWLHATRGPQARQSRSLNFSDFERQFVGLASARDVSYAVQQYFLNDGNEAWIVRVASGAVTVDAFEESGQSSKDELR